MTFPSAGAVNCQSKQEPANRHLTCPLDGLLRPMRRSSVSTGGLTKGILKEELSLLWVQGDLAVAPARTG